MYKCPLTTNTTSCNALFNSKNLVPMYVYKLIYTIQNTLLKNILIKCRMHVKKDHNLWINGLLNS